MVQLQALLRELADLRSDMLQLEAGYRARIADVHPAYRRSTSNLFHYLALRKRDIRPLQENLAALGLSSLGRSESHVLASVHAVLEVLHRLDGREWHRPATVEPEVSFDEGKALLDTHTEALLGWVHRRQVLRPACIGTTLPALTTQDMDDLAFIAKHADLVGYSFVRQASDVDELHAWPNSTGPTSVSC